MGENWDQVQKEVTRVPYKVVKGDKFATIYESDNRRSSTFTFTVCNYYRFVTFKYSNTRVCTRVPYKVVKGDNNTPRVDIDGRLYTPQEISAMILQGVVRLPSLFAITTGSLPSNTATQEFVVPKSIPIIFPMCKTSGYY